MQASKGAGVERPAVKELEPALVFGATTMSAARSPTLSARSAWPTSYAIGTGRRRLA